MYSQIIDNILERVNTLEEKIEIILQRLDQLEK